MKLAMSLTILQQISEGEVRMACHGAQGPLQYGESAGSSGLVLPFWSLVALPSNVPQLSLPSELLNYLNALY